VVDIAESLKTPVPPKTSPDLIVVNIVAASVSDAVGLVISNAVVVTAADTLV